ncbi:hypothetical protein LH433_02450 [Laribacter hongkongensis]|uniref:hypothetical protein n=1 Tax=Laribacter hongkongensis TaxID=168471 RepID=UPI001EFE502F|nr:hypothetical protein [Laribacter hongkongensis]MCG9105617.1 hypothetical protein [Laribacter hongkongensis]
MMAACGFMTPAEHYALRWCSLEAVRLYVLCIRPFMHADSLEVPVSAVKAESRSLVAARQQKPRISRLIGELERHLLVESRWTAGGRLASVVCVAARDVACGKGVL